MKTLTVLKNFSMATAGVGVITLSLGFGAKANAALITHSAQDFTGTLTPPFGTLTQPVGTFFIPKGVNYTFGNQEGVFSDPPNALGGINASGIADLLTAVDGQIVLPGTSTQGVTDFLFVEAGFADAGRLTLTAFDHNLLPIASVTNGLPLGPNGRTTLTIDRLGIFDIAFFSVSGGDTFGVNTVTIDTPRAKSVPEPSLVLGLLTFGALSAGSMLKRKLK